MHAVILPSFALAKMSEALSRKLSASAEPTRSGGGRASRRQSVGYKTQQSDGYVLKDLAPPNFNTKRHRQWLEENLGPEDNGVIFMTGGDGLGFYMNVHPDAAVL